jgi:hypothetical protein
MPPEDAVLAEFALHNFRQPDQHHDDPLSEELMLPPAVSTAYGLAPTVSVVLENGRLTVLIRRTSRTGTAELTAVIEGGGGRVQIPLSRLGSWLRGAADWAYAAPERLVIASATTG